MRRQTETPGPSKGSSLPKQPGATRKCSDARGESCEVETTVVPLKVVLHHTCATCGESWVEEEWAA